MNGSLSAITVYSFGLPVARRVLTTSPTARTPGRAMVALVITPVIGAVIGSGLAAPLAIITPVVFPGPVPAVHEFPKSPSAADAGLGVSAVPMARAAALRATTSLRMGILLRMVQGHVPKKTPAA